MRQDTLPFKSRTRNFACLLGVTCLWLSTWSTGIVHAQGEKELAIAPPERVTLKTDDGVDLDAMWYAGGVATTKDKGLRKIDGDKVVPVIILHGWDETNREFSAIASYLQSLGHAVLVPDLRGHGRSKVMVQTRTGEMEKERKDFTAVDLALMASDMISLKRFLLIRNNKKELNIELLCVIASEESSIVAANWVLLDWSYPDLLDRKQGKDVKGLILLSPVRNFNGYHWNDTMKQPVFSGLNPVVFTMPMLIIVGNKDQKAYREAKTIYSRLETSRKRLHQSFKEEERREKHTLFLVERDTELQGWKLLDPRLNLNLHTQIAGFIDYKLAKKATEDAYKFNGERKFRSAD